MAIITAFNGVTFPSRTQSSTTFNTNADALMTAFNTFSTELNTYNSDLSALAAGSAIAIPYTFSTTTTDSDPGAGYLRLNQATQNTATVIRTDLSGSNGSDYTNFLELVDDSTSSIKGYILLQKVNDSSKFLLFSVSSLASPSGYRNITVVNVASSAASPFSNGDSIVFKFTPNGDKGATGTSGALLLLNATPTAAANYDALNLFTSAYDFYLLRGMGINNGSGTDAIRIQLATGGSVDTGSNYYSNTLATTSTTTSATSIQVTSSVINTGKGCIFDVLISNTNSSSYLKSMIINSSSQSNATPTLDSRSTNNVYNAANTVSGFRLYWNGGANFAAQGLIQVFGFKNS